MLLINNTNIKKVNKEERSFSRFGDENLDKDK